MSNRSTGKRFSALTVLCATLALPVVAHAVPTLQVYVEGATYNPVSETWVINTDNSGGTVVIAATTAQNDNTKKTEDLYNTHMVVSALTDTSFNASLSGGDGSLSFTNAASTAGDSPILTGGDAQNAKSYIDFGIGDFTGKADPIPNYDGTYTGGTSTGNALGNSQTYVLTLSNLTGSVIIDAYGHLNNTNGEIVVAPFSHNGEISPSASVPELSGHGAGSAAVFLVGVGLIFGSRRRRR